MPLPFPPPSPPIPPTLLPCLAVYCLAVVHTYGVGEAGKKDITYVGHVTSQ